MRGQKVEGVMGRLRPHHRLVVCVSWTFFSLLRSFHVVFLPPHWCVVVGTLLVGFTPYTFRRTTVFTPSPSSGSLHRLSGADEHSGIRSQALMSWLVTRQDDRPLYRLQHFPVTSVVWGVQKMPPVLLLAGASIEADCN